MTKSPDFDPYAQTAAPTSELATAAGALPDIPVSITLHLLRRSQPTDIHIDLSRERSR